MVRQAEQKRKRALQDLNRAIAKYNREARAHNARVRANQQRLRRELQVLARQPTPTRTYVTYRVWVRRLQTSFVRLESAPARTHWGQLATNSVDVRLRAVLDADRLVGRPGRRPGPHDASGASSVGQHDRARLTRGRRRVIEWLHEHHVAWMALAVFAIVFLLSAAIYLLVIGLATGERGRAFARVSPGLLPPLGIIFGLLVGFLAVQVWNDADEARVAVDREASALRAAVLLSERFPGRPEGRIRELVRRHVQQAAADEWPAMAEQRATLTPVPSALAAALRTALALQPNDAGQEIAQRELVASLENALDARRQRIIVSESSVNWVKWVGVMFLAALTLLAIAFVHSENRATTALAMAIFASAVAVSITIIAAQERPFSGQFGVEPDPLLQVAPR